MKHHGFPLLILSLLVITSCQKEIYFESESDQIPIDTTGRMFLAKLVSQAPENSDSIVLSFKYDNLKRLVEYDVTSSNPAFINENYKIIRNGNGRIYKVITTISDPFLAGPQTITYSYFFDATGQYKYRIGESKGVSTDFKDSTVYQYDINNKITQQRNYKLIPGVTPFEVQRKNYVYDDNSNLIEATSYTDVLGSGILRLDVVSTYGYDSNKNPMRFDNESLIIGHVLVGLPSENNVSREILQYPQDPSRNEIRDYIYTYNSSGYPSTVISTIDGVKQHLRYYYL